jgi:hypothetical protein
MVALSKSLTKYMAGANAEIEALRSRLEQLAMMTRR